MQDFRRLFVWQKATRLTAEIYRTVNRAPARRFPGLRSQLLRATASIATNIAEGCGRRSHREFIHFGEIAIASASEAEHHLALARELGFISAADHDRHVRALIEVRRMLFGLLKTLRARKPEG